MKTKIEIIRDCINNLRSKGLEVNEDSVIAESLFQPFGTLGANDSELIAEEFWRIRESIEQRVNRKYKPEGSFVSGLAVSVEVNAFFNYDTKI